MFDEIRELTLQLYLPLLAMMMEDQRVSKAEIITAGENALQLIHDHELYEHLDTKKDLDVYRKLLSGDLEALNLACLKKTMDMYFIYEEMGTYHIANTQTSYWLSAKGIAIMVRYSDDLTFLTKLQEQLSLETLEKAKNVIEMIAKDKQVHHIHELISLINDIMRLDPKAYELRLQGLQMIEKATLPVYDQCDLSNQMAYGLMTAAKLNLLNIGKQHLDAIKEKMAGLEKSEKNDLQIAKIDSNIGAYYQGRFKLDKNREDIEKAIAYHKQALQMRQSLQSPTVANSYLTLASDDFHAYNLTHDVNYLRASLDNHLLAYERLSNDEEAYKNLIRIAGTKIMLCLEDYDEAMVSSIYDDLARSYVVAMAHYDTKELRNIKENFKESLELFKNHPCSHERYDQIYRLARQIDEEDGYFEDLVRRKL